MSETVARVGGREPDARLAPILQNGRLANLVLSDGARHAGDTLNPRPLPHTPLTEVRDRAIAQSGGCSVREAVHFAIYADRYRVAPEVAVSVPTDHLWWFANMEDTILLSDRVTHHYTAVDHVDRTNDRIYFLDPWPADFFLLKGRNTLGIAAQTEGKLGLSVSKEEFLRAVVGLVIFDTSSLITSYLKAFAHQRRDSQLHVRFGYALLASGDDGVAAEAAALFAEALGLADTGTDRELAARAARQAYLAAACGRFAAQERRDGEMYRAMEGILYAVLSRYQVPALETALSGFELCRLGEAAGRVGELAMARRALDLAIVKNANDERAHASRAVARVYGGDAPGAAADAARAVVLNDAARLRVERAAIDQRARWELMWKDGEIAGRTGWRTRELATLVKALCALGSFDHARIAAKELLDLEPHRPEHRARLAEVERMARSS